MLVLHFDVTDVPYSTGQTTGDVAEILEAKYEVMEHFAKSHEDDIASDLENSLEGELEKPAARCPSIA
jgi:hypothetical protein